MKFAVYWVTMPCSSKRAKQVLAHVCLLASLGLLPWKREQYIPLEFRTLSELHDVTTRRHDHENLWKNSLFNIRNIVLKRRIVYKIFYII